MMNRLFRRKKEQSYLDEHIIWGIWAPRSLKPAYKIMATDLRVPISVLVGHILTQWLAQNGRNPRVQELPHDNRAHGMPDMRARALKG